MAERHFVNTEGFTANPIPNKEHDMHESTSTPEIEQEELQSASDFEKEYGVKEIIVSAYREIHGEDSIVPLEIGNRIETHLREEFGAMKGDKKTIKEDIQSTAIKLIKMRNSS